MLNKGDTIKCHDAAEAVMLMTELEHEGYSTDFLYEKEGEKGIWIEILGVPKS